MITQEEYKSRRAKLMDSVNDGVIYLKGNDEIQRNPDVPYEFRQNSHFRYLTGINIPGVSMMLIPKDRRYILFAPEFSIDDQVWRGPKPTLAEFKEQFGADEIHTPDEIGSYGIDLFFQNLGSFHTVTAYPEQFSTLARNEKLAKAIIEMRLVKSPDEIALIEKALDVTLHSYHKAITHTQPGINERDIQASIEHTYRTHGATYAFPPIVTMDGNVLDHFENGNQLVFGRMLLIDSGAEVEGYASDITRTIPVNGKFSPEQHAIYNIVLEAKKQAARALRPGINYRDIHMLAEGVIAEGLIDCGILRGNISDILENGAHRLFFVHGLGHPLGLDDHDCGDFRDWTAGYSEQNPRSNKFGLKSLRYARVLKPSNVMTIEPGIYFIPTLLNNPEIRRQHGEFVDFDKALKLEKTVSGIRIEDVFLVTPKGHRRLGLKIPEEIDDLEQIIGKY